MSKVCILFIVALALNCASASAADDSPKIELTRTPAGTISFEDALELALQNSPKIRKSKVLVGIANQEWMRARSAFLPKLDISSTTQKIEAFGSLPGIESLLLSGRRNAYHSTSNIRLSLNAYNGGADLAGMRIATEKIQDARLQWQVQRATIALVVLEHVHAVRQAEIDLRIALLHLELSAKQLDQANTGLSVGRVSAFSLSEAQYDFKSKELIRTTKERAYQHALRNLVTAIGAENDSSRWTRSSSELRGYSEVLARHDLESMSAASEIGISESRIRQAQREIERARSTYLPQVDLFARTDYAAISESNYDKAFNGQRKDKAFIGFTLTWNLFDGFNTTAGVNAAAQRIASAQADLDITLEEQRKEAGNVMRLLEDSEEDLLIESKHLDLLRMKLDISREKVNLGRLDVVAFNAIETEWDVQKLDVERRGEQVAYYRAKLLLRQGRE